LFAQACLSDAQILHLACREYENAGNTPKGCMLYIPHSGSGTGSALSRMPKRALHRPFLTYRFELPNGFLAVSTWPLGQYRPGLATSSAHTWFGRIHPGHSCTFVRRICDAKPTRPLHRRPNRDGARGNTTGSFPNTLLGVQRSIL
jgi:hypothetical protein